jgi:hypothetical protein
LFDAALGSLLVPLGNLFGCESPIRELFVEFGAHICFGGVLDLKMVGAAVEMRILPDAEVAKGNSRWR